MESIFVGETVAQYSQRDGNAHGLQRVREHGSELRVSDIPAEAMAIISDCQVPLMLIGITWPHDLTKSPLLYANNAMLDLIGGNTETDHPAGLPLGVLFRIEGLDFRCMGEAESYSVRQTDLVRPSNGVALAVEPLTGTLMIVPV